jgi:anti-sigma-K factor RskA
MTHQELVDSAALYALDALDGEERAALEAHLPECEQCRAEVASFREVSGLLAYSAPRAKPANDSAIRDRIVRRAREDATRKLPAASDAQPTATPVIPLRPAATHTAQSRPWATQLAWLVAAASLVLFALGAMAYRGERAERERLQGEIASARNEVALRDSTLSSFLGPEVHVVSLSAGKGKPAVRVFWNHTKNVFIVTAQDFPSAPAGKTYQLWAMPKGKTPVSMGTFDTDARGRATTVLAVAPGIVDAGFIDDCGLTLEPAGGSAQPTEQPRLIGTWRHVD